MAAPSLPGRAVRENAPHFLSLAEQGSASEIFGLQRREMQNPSSRRNVYLVGIFAICAAASSVLFVQLKRTSRQTGPEFENLNFVPTQRPADAWAVSLRNNSVKQIDLIKPGYYVTVEGSSDPVMADCLSIYQHQLVGRTTTYTSSNDVADSLLKFPLKNSDTVVIVGHGFTDRRRIHTWSGTSAIEAKYRYMDAHNVSDWRVQMNKLQGHVGHILFLSCVLGQGQDGADFVHQVAEATGASVAAPTGTITACASEHESCSGDAFTAIPSTRWQVAEAGLGVPKNIYVNPLHLTLSNGAVYLAPLADNGKLGGDKAGVHQDMRPQGGSSKAKPATNYAPLLLDAKTIVDCKLIAGYDSPRTISINPEQAFDLLKQIDFKNPHNQGGSPLCIPSSVLRVTLHDPQGAEQVREFAVVDTNIVFDVSARALYFTSDAFETRLKSYLVKNAIPYTPKGLPHVTASH